MQNNADYYYTYYYYCSVKHPLQKKTFSFHFLPESPVKVKCFINAGIKKKEANQSALKTAE